MFQSLSDRLAATFQQVRGHGRITEENITQSLRDVRVALLEADVALPVVTQFVAQVKTRALGQEVLRS
ncbi:MAG: signal recognition particle receptor subunit alpha, partial [Pseudomonadota bacterium]